MTYSKQYLLKKSAIIATFWCEKKIMIASAIVQGNIMH